MGKVVQETQRIGKSAVEMQIEHSRYVFDKQIEFAHMGNAHSLNYNNVIVLAGYGAFFAIWSQVAPDIGKSARALSGGLMAISLISYVIWTVYEMLLNARTIERVAACFEYANQPQRFEKEWVATQLNAKKLIERSNRFVWLPTFIVSLLFGLIGGSVLGYNALALVMEMPLWPHP